MGLALSEMLTALSVDQNLVVEAIQLEEPQEPGPRQLVLPLTFRWAPEDLDESASS